MFIGVSEYKTLHAVLLSHIGILMLLLAAEPSNIAELLFPPSIIIVKTSSTSPSGRKKVVYKLLLQPHKHMRHGKLKKTQLREATNGGGTLEPIQRTGVKHSVWKVILHSNQGRRKHLANLFALHLDTSN